MHTLVLTEVKELKNTVKSLESTVKNLSTSMKSLSNSNSGFDVINKRRRTSNVYDFQIGPVTRSNKNTSNIISKKSARTLSKNAVTKVTSLSNSSLEVSHRSVSLDPNAQSDYGASKLTAI